MKGRAPNIRAKRGEAMTVCIAAICTSPEGLMIVGASDRMLSGPDLKYEPAQKKTYHFYPWVAALVAGDPYAQTTILSRCSAVFEKRPPKTVEEVAMSYADAFTRYRREKAEARFLKPLGLDANSLLDRQGDFPRDL